jgi:hypothetical protein
MAISKVHVTLTAGILGAVAMVCAVVVVGLALSAEAEITTVIALAAPFLTITGTAMGVIGGVAVPTSPPSSDAV